MLSGCQQYQNECGQNDKRERMISFVYADWVTPVERLEERTAESGLERFE